MARRPLGVEDSDIGIGIAIIIGRRAFLAHEVAMHIKASLTSPFIQAELRPSHRAGIGDLAHVVIGMDATIRFSGNENFSEAYSMPMTVIDVQVPDSSSLQSPAGELVIKLISRWAYQAKVLPTKTYMNVEEPHRVIQEEFRDVGYEGDDVIDVLQEPEELEKPLNFYRTRGSLHFLNERVIPWCLMPDDSSPFWYMNLKGQMCFQTPVNMLSQGVTAFVGPAFMDYPYSENVPGYAFNRRSYKTNPKRTDLFYVDGHYYAQGERKSFHEDGVIDREGKAIQMERDLGLESIEAWYIGHRPLQQMRAHAKFLRRNHLFHQIHVLTFDDLQTATHCDVGTIVRLYDFDLYMPRTDQDAAPPEELSTSNMMGEYIVAASHFYFDEKNEDGFKGSKLELVKFGHDEEALDGIENIGTYVDV